MDVVGAYVNLQHASLISQVQTAAVRKVLDAQKLQGQAALQLLDAAANTTSQAGDALVAAATGLGANLDVYG